MIQSITLPDGNVVRMGNRVPLRGKPKAFAALGDSGTNTRVTERKEWPALLAAYEPGPEHPNLPDDKNQNGIGQCNPTAAALAMEHRRRVQGLRNVILSPADLYARINGGHDDGSLLEDALAELRANGIGTSATCGDLWKRGEFKGEASGAERARFRADEVFLCPTFDHVFSAALDGFSLVSGVFWYDNFTPDADGWLPDGRGNKGGHAIFGFKPAVRDGEFGVWHKQTWGPGWSPHTGGHFVIPESHYNEGGIGGWYAVRQVTDEGGVVPAEAAA